ncbi:MAG: DUF1573 domain-containing protein [Alistipes sp.]
MGGLAAAPLRAQIRIVPRAKLDSLAHPATAAGGAEAMRFERTLIDAGHIGEDDVPPVYTFRWRNTGGKPLVVTRVQTTWAAPRRAGTKPVAPGGEGAVTVTYRPGTSGVSTGGFSSTPSSRTRSQRRSSASGAQSRPRCARTTTIPMRWRAALKQRTVRFGRTDKVQSERIECLNAGDKPLTPLCDEGFAATGLSFACEPATLAPGAKAIWSSASTRPKPRSRSGGLPAGRDRTCRRVSACCGSSSGKQNKKQDKNKSYEKILRFAALLSALALLGACDDDMYVTPLEVTNNLAGTWQLAQWNGAPLAQGSYVYIEFIRKDQKYVMYQNLDSFGARKLTGRFAIETDEELGAIIYGNYDYSAGDWQHRYIVTDFSKTQMIWTAKDDRSDISVYERCDGIPEDITGGKTEE